MNTFQFKSTRGDPQRVDAPQAIFQGLAPDGGLFVPETFPQLGLDLGRLHEISYPDLACHTLKSWLPGYPAEVLDRVVARGYRSGIFDAPEFVPIQSFGNRHFIELFHGPTLAFKDLALSLLPHLLVEARDLLGISKEVVILTATSGDTGSAALTGFADLLGTRIIVFYPDRGISPVQKKQMTCQPGENLFVCAVDGNFDQAQTVVKNLFSDPEISRVLAENNSTFSTANSMNIGRLVPQMVYYFHAYGQLVQRQAVQPGDPINVVVPSGNFGNILAAWYAKQAGLPIQKFIVASNPNHVLTDFFKTGIYEANRDFYRTHSPSMDILVSSNLERLLYHLSGNDDALIATLMHDLKTDRRYEVPPALKTALQADFYAAFADDTTCQNEIKKQYESSGYLLDPHTAVAANVLTRYQEETGDTTPALIAATASPYKFPATVLPALFSDDDQASDFDRIRTLAARTNQTIPVRIQNLETQAPLHTDHCTPATAANYTRAAITAVK